MSKQNSNINDLLNSLTTNLLQEDALDTIKTQIIKEELKNNTYKINNLNIANKMLEFSIKHETEVTA